MNVTLDPWQAWPPNNQQYTGEKRNYGWSTNFRIRGTSPTALKFCWVLSGPWTDLVPQAASFSINIPRLQKTAKDRGFLWVHLTWQGAASPWDYTSLLMLTLSREEAKAARSSPLLTPMCEIVFRSSVCPAVQGQHSALCVSLRKPPNPNQMVPAPLSHPCSDIPQT